MWMTDKVRIGLANSNPVYGIFPRGQMNSTILKDVWKLGIRKVDSADDYMFANQILRESNLDWKIQTKFKIPESHNDFDSLFNRINSLVAKSKVESLLIHNSDFYLHKHANRIIDDLKIITSEVGISSLGISIYRPRELEGLNSWKKLDVIQFPHNPLDTNCLTWLMKNLKENTPKLQTRSIYLQGILISEGSKLTNLPWELVQVILNWQNWLVDNNLSAQEYCARFAINETRIEEIVVGVDSSKQLEDLLKFEVNKEKMPMFEDSVSEKASDPRSWFH